ncbi:MAG: O-antigen ligase family protein [Chloroflexota bacterium]
MRAVAVSDARSPVTREWGTWVTVALLSAVISIGIVVGSPTLSAGGAILAIAASLMAPMVGLMVLAFVAPLLWAPVLPTPGLTMMLAGATLLGAIFRLPLERPRLTVHPLLVVVMSFVIFVFVRQLPSLLGGYQTPQEYFTGALMIKLVTALLVIMAGSIVLKDRSPYPVMASLLAAAVLVVIVALTETGEPGLLGNLVARSSEISGRSSGPFTDPNEFGLYVAGALTLAIGWLLARPSRWTRLLLVAVSLVLGWGLIASMSRTGLAAAAAGIVTLAFSRSRRTGFAVLGALIVVGLLLYPLLIQARVANSTGAATESQLVAQVGLEQSDASRLAFVLSGPRVFLSAPLFGIGLGAFIFETGHSAHNYYMTVAAEQGIVGFILWMAMLIGGIATLSRRPPVPRAVGLAVMLVFVVGSLFLNPPEEEQSLLFFVIVFVAALVADWRTGAADGRSIERPGARVARPSRALT